MPLLSFVFKLNQCRVHTIFLPPIILIAIIKIYSNYYAAATAKSLLSFYDVDDCDAAAIIIQPDNNRAHESRVPNGNGYSSARARRRTKK